jgi:polyisoprenoid-binding protein YceI
VHKVQVHPLPQQRGFVLALAAMAMAAALVVGSRGVYAQESQEPTGSAVTESPAAVQSPVTDTTEAGGIDGTWTLDTELGDFEDFTSSWVGFRVAEVLDNIGEAEAVGRTPAVSGELTVAGTTLESASIEADLTGIRSDQSRRDPAIQRALETSDFPTATFTSSAPVDLGAVPVEGEPFMATVPGVLNIHGVDQEVSLELSGQRVGDVVAVVGTLPLDFTSFGITMPTAPIVVSVEDSGDLEWQLFFSKG